MRAVRNIRTLSWQTLRGLLVLVLLLNHTPARSQVQVYPVSVTTQITPPYSVDLPDYASPGNEKLKVIILQRDLTQAPYSLYLKMEISLNGRTIIRSSQNYVPEAFILEPGTPTLISGSSLAPYFDPANLEFTGFSREQYTKTRTFPEGAYNITFTAYDWTRRDVALSHGGSFFCYLARSEPPLLNLPFNNSTISDKTPQYINFQWLSRTASSPNSGFTTRYRLELFEVRVAGLSSSEIAAGSKPIFASETDNTNFIYSITDPPLEKGMRYVWRVRAFDTGGKDYIRNNGYSEVFSFVYGEEGTGFNAPGNFTARAVSPRKAVLSWDAAPASGSYKVYYRKNGSGGRWYEKETIHNNVEVTGLIPGEIYECKVQGKTGNSWGEFSFDTVKMPRLPVIECGTPFQNPEISNHEPLPELMKLQQFDAGGFIVTLIDDYAIPTAPGRFSGNGYVEVPLFGHKKIRCEFNDIFINTDYQLVEGIIRLITDNREGQNALWDIDEVFEGGGDNGKVKEGTEEISFFVPDIVIADAGSLFLDTSTGEILIVDEPGDTVRFDVTGKLADNPGALTVKDSEGNLYSVDTKTGQSTALGKAPAPGSTPQQLTSLPAVVSTKVGRVTFEKAPQTRFAFDQRNTTYAKSNLFNLEYSTMDADDGSLYEIPFKLIPAGEIDVVLAKADLKVKGRLEFRSGTGTVYKADSLGKGKYLLTLPSGKQGDGIDVFATFTDSYGRVSVLGKLIIMSYSMKRPELTLVPVGGNGRDIDPAEVKKELDKVYRPVAVDWQVRMDDSGFNHEAGDLDITGSGLFSMYTEGMKKLNNDFILHKGENFNPATVYLFLLSKSADGNATGDMPRGKQFGYVFTATAGKAGLHRTIAHEIAHGAFSLSHTFDKKYDLPEKSTPNLMDYTAGTDLVKHQWDAIHDPGWNLFGNWFQSAEDGAMMTVAGEEELRKTLLTLGVNACAYCQRCDDPVQLDGARYYFKDGKKFRCTFGVLKEDNTIESKDKEISQLDLKVDETQSVFDQTILSENRLKFVVLLKKLDASLKPQICDAYENYGNDYCSKAEPFSEKSFTDKVIADINKCKQPENGRILNYSSVTDIPNQEHLIELLSGNDIKNDPTGQRHTSKAWLVLTDATTTTENYTKAQNFQAPSGESKVWLHKTDKGWELKPDLPQGVKDLENLTDGAGNKIYDMAKFAGEMALEGIDFVATAYYEMYDAAAKGIRKLRIPNYAWDDTDPDYSKVYAYVYKFVLIGIAPVKELFIYGASNGLALYLDNKAPEVSNILRKLGDGRIEFAFVCGVWNGAVETVAAVPDLLKLIVTPMSSKGREEFGKFYATLKGFELADETGKVIDSGVLCAIKTGFKQQFSTDLKAAESTGEIAFVVALCFVDPAAIESAGAKTIATIVKVLQRFDAIADKLNPASYALRFTTDLTAKLVNKSRNKVCGAIKDGFLKAKAITSKGKVIDDFSENIDNIGLKDINGEIIATKGSETYDLLDELPGYTLKESAGYGVYSKALPVSNGKYTERIFAIKAGDGGSPAKFFEEIEAKALAQGATEIEIVGESVINKSFEKHADLFNTKWGYKFEKVTENGEEVIKLTKKLRFTAQEIEGYVLLATKQGDKSKVMLGMWDGGGASSYITKAGEDYTYFDFGDKWNEAYNLVNKNDDEIWRINKEFIDRQKKVGKEFWFSHNPFSPKNEQFFAKEVNYLLDLGVKDFQKVGELWKAIW